MTRPRLTESIHIRLDATDYARLREGAKERGLGVSTLIRMTIKAGLNRTVKTKK